MVVTERQPCTATLRSEIIFVQSAKNCGRFGKKQKDFRSPAIRMDNDVAAICPHKKTVSCLMKSRRMMMI